MYLLLAANKIYHLCFYHLARLKTTLKLFIFFIQSVRNIKLQSILLGIPYTDGPLK